jgi:hypothetical protein
VSSTLVELATRYYFLSESCGLISVGRPLRRYGGSAICSAITQWSESRRTSNHTLLSHLRLPQPRGPGSRIYNPQEKGGPVIPPGIGFPLRRLLRLIVSGYKTNCSPVAHCISGNETANSIRNPHVRTAFLTHIFLV